MTLTRRTMLKTSAAAAAVTGLRLWGPSTAWAGANDRCGSRSSASTAWAKITSPPTPPRKTFRWRPYATWMKTSSKASSRTISLKKPAPPKTYTDIRKLLEDKDIDAVSVVTPNHWHTLASIWAIQAGKHVSVEKPCCHNFFEGQQLVEAAKNTT